MERSRRSSRNIELANKIVQNLENKNNTKEEKVKDIEKENENYKSNSKNKPFDFYDISSSQKEALDEFFSLANNSSKNFKNVVNKEKDNDKDKEQDQDQEDEVKEEKKKSHKNKYKINNVSDNEHIEYNLNNNFLTPQEKKEILKEQVKNGKIPYSQKNHFNENLDNNINSKKEITKEEIEQTKKKQEISLKDFQDMMEKEELKEKEKEKRKKEKKENEDMNIGENIYKEMRNVENVNRIKNNEFKNNEFKNNKQLSITKILIFIETILILAIVIFTIAAMIKPNIIIHNRYLSKIILNKKEEGKYFIGINKINLNREIISENNFNNNKDKYADKDDLFVAGSNLDFSNTSAKSLFVENESKLFLDFSKLQEKDLIEINKNNKFEIVKITEMKNSEIDALKYNKENYLYIFVPIRKTNSQLIIEAKKK